MASVLGTYTFTAPLGLFMIWWSFWPVQPEVNARRRPNRLEGLLIRAGIERASAGGLISSCFAVELLVFGIVNVATGAPDGRTAHVVLSAVAHPPIINFLVPAGIEVVAVSDARPQLGR